MASQDTLFLCSVGQQFPCFVLSLFLIVFLPKSRLLFLQNCSYKKKSVMQCCVHFQTSKMECFEKIVENAPFWMFERALNTPILEMNETSHFLPKSSKVPAFLALINTVLPLDRFQ